MCIFAVYLPHHTPWLTPDLRETQARLAHQGKKSLVVWGMFRKFVEIIQLPNSNHIFSKFLIENTKQQKYFKNPSCFSV